MGVVVIVEVWVVFIFWVFVDRLELVFNFFFVSEGSYIFLLVFWYLRLVWALFRVRVRYWFFSFLMFWLWVWEERRG